MIENFETMRYQYQQKKVHKEMIRVIISSVIFVFMGIVSLGNSAFWGVTLICCLVFVSFYRKYDKSMKLREDVTLSRFYHSLMKRFDSYDEACTHLSESLKNDCLYQQGTLYITRDWVIDFGETDIDIIDLDRIIWIYGVIFNGMAYVKGILDDTSEYVIRSSEREKIISIISYIRPRILVGYSHQIYRLMEKNPQDFVNYIQNGIYPNDEGKWMY